MHSCLMYEFNYLLKCQTGLACMSPGVLHAHMRTINSAAVGVEGSQRRIMHKSRDTNF